MDKVIFEIGEFVEDQATGMTGEIIGKAEYKYEPTQYLVKSDFKGPDGTYANRWIPAQAAVLLER
jgi:hypothetical protein